MYQTSGNIIEANKQAGRYFFSHNTMRSFKTKIVSPVINSNWLIIKNNATPKGGKFKAIFCNHLGHIFQGPNCPTEKEARLFITLLESNKSKIVNFYSLQYIRTGKSVARVRWSTEKNQYWAYLTKWNKERVCYFDNSIKIANQ